MKRPFTKAFVRSVVGVTALAVVGFVVHSKFWQLLDYDKDWCDRVEREAAPIIAALRHYKDTHGVYPPRLDDLAPAFVAAINPPRPGGEQEAHGWNYDAFDGGADYRLYVTTLHWVSSFDVLLYRSDEHYPKEWWRNPLGEKVIHHNGWVYIVGGSGIIR